jgi:hypothetical protein
MKSILWLVASTAILGGIASATSITCMPFGAAIPNGGGAAGQTIAVTCPGFTPDPGFNLSSITLTYVGDYEFGTTTPVDVQFTFTPVSLGGVMYTPPTATIDVTGGFSSGVSASASAIAGSFNNLSFASGLTVNVTSKVIAGVVHDSEAGVTLNWTETSGVPEPSTMGLLGASLLGLGLVRRMKRK